MKWRLLLRVSDNLLVQDLRCPLQESNAERNANYYSRLKDLENHMDKRMENEMDAVALGIGAYGPGFRTTS